MTGVGMLIHVRLPLPAVADAVGFLNRHRVGVEITLTSDLLDGDPAEVVTTVSGALSRSKIPCSLHAPFVDLSPGSPDAMVREVTKLRLRQAADIAARLLPRHVVVHPGYDRWRNGPDAARWQALSIPVWLETARALPKGTTVLFENVFEEQPTAIASLLSVLPEQRFGFCFDTGHCNLFSTVTAEHWLKVLGGRLGAVHLHDNGGLDDDHRPLGEGKIDFTPVYAVLRRKSVIGVLEHNSLDEIGRSLQKLGNVFDTM